MAVQRGSARPLLTHAVNTVLHVSLSIYERSRSVARGSGGGGVEMLLLGLKGEVGVVTRVMPGHSRVVINPRISACNARTGGGT